jgi:polysaccharide pyruvyl transferase WcaK-like protein
MSHRPSIIALMGPYGFGNLGDAAIQQAMSAAIRRRLPQAKIVGISLNPADTAARHGITAYSIGHMANCSWELQGRMGEFLQCIQMRLYSHPSGWLRRLARLFLAPLVETFGILQSYGRMKDWTAVFASGGGQLDDDWGGAWHHPYSMWLWGRLCRASRVRYRFVSVGAGPLNARQSERFACGALASADYRSFRDERSRQFMAERGFFRDDPIYPDLAHSLPVADYLAGPRREFPSPEFTGRIVGLGPMAYYDPRVWPYKDQSVYMDYLQKLVEFSAWLVGRGYRILLFPGEAVHDRDVIQDFLQLAAARRLRLGEELCAPLIESVDELMHNLAGVDLVVASRFHGVLLPMLLDKPILSTSYHPKVDELMKDTGQADYCLSIASFSVAELQERFTRLETNREIVSTQIHRRIEEYRQALEEQYDHIFNDL